MLPGKPKAELYTSLGLQKQGKTLFYRDFLHHLNHSTDDFIVAPGIRGLVMVVFTLPSFPYVFKVIKDDRAEQEHRPADVKDRYQLVKRHDRVGRMADYAGSTPTCRFRRPASIRHCWRSCSRCAVAGRRRRRPPGRAPPVHRAAHDAAQHLSR